MNKSVLFISYFFPPVGGAGVQRAVKFVKYLPEYGWNPTVLTVENPSVPLFDKSLEDEIPAGIEICKAKTLEPGYAVKNAVSASNQETNNFFSLKLLAKKVLRSGANMVLQPDPQVLWMPAAYREGKRILKSKNYDAIIATGPPFSSFLLGARLSQVTGVPLLLDYRDEWDISNSVWENKKLGKISLALQKQMQKYAINRAKALVATTEMSVNALKKIGESTQSKPTSKTCYAFLWPWRTRLDLQKPKSHEPERLHEKVNCSNAIYNGYDPDDFKTEISKLDNKSNGKYQLSYVGTLWNLTSIEPLVKAIEVLDDKYPELSKSLELVIAGRKTAEQELILSRLENTGMTLTVHDYLDHSKAVDLMKTSNGLCLLLSDLEVAGRVVPAKIFEYLACRNSILAIAPEGEVWNILKDYPAAYCSAPSDVDSIVQNLVTEIKRFQNKENIDTSDYDPSQFNRKNQTGELAGILDQISGKPNDLLLDKTENNSSTINRKEIKQPETVVKS